MESVIFWKGPGWYAGRQENNQVLYYYTGGLKPSDLYRKTHVLGTPIYYKTEDEFYNK